MAATQKAQALIRVLTDKLNQRVGAGDAVASFDSNSDAYLTLTVSTGNHSKKAMVRVVPFPTIQTDALGLTERVVGPHIVQVLFDSNASGATIAQKAAVLGEVFRWGARVDWYEVDATAIALTDITSGNLKTSFDDLEWPFIGSM